MVFLFFLSLINAFPDAQIFLPQLASRLQRFLAWKVVIVRSGWTVAVTSPAPPPLRCPGRSSPLPFAHLVGDMRVGVQGGGAGHMAQDGGQRLDVHSMGQGIGCESMAQIVKANVLTSRMLQQCVKPSADCRGDNRQIVLLGARGITIGEFTLVLYSASTFLTDGAGSELRTAALVFRLTDYQFRTNEVSCLLILNSR